MIDEHLTGTGQIIILQCKFRFFNMVIHIHQIPQRLHPGHIAFVEHRIIIRQQLDAVREQPMQIMDHGPACLAVPGTVGIADGGTAPEEAPLGIAGNRLYLIPFEQIHFSVGKLQKQIRKPDIITKAVVPVAEALHTGAILREAGHEALHGIQQAGQLLLEPFRFQIHHGTADVAGTNRCPVVGIGLPALLPVQVIPDHPLPYFHSGPFQHQLVQPILQQVTQFRHGKAGFRIEQVYIGQIIFQCRIGMGRQCPGIFITDCPQYLMHFVQIVLLFRINQRQQSCGRKKGSAAEIGTFKLMPVTVPVEAHPGAVF